MLPATRDEDRGHPPFWTFRLLDDPVVLFSSRRRRIDRAAPEHPLRPTRTLCGEYEEAPWIKDQSASLTVGLESALVGRNECPIAFAADGEADDVSVGVIVLYEGPDDDGVRAVRRLHLRPMQGGGDLKDFHLHHGKRGDP